MTGNFIEDICAQSPMQEAMFRETLRAPGSGVNINHFVWTLSGTMNFFAFEQAWRHITTRHSILRTLFLLTKNDKPLQVVHRSVECNLRVEDWRKLSDARQALELGSFLKEDARRGFDLAKSPPMRLCLIQTSDEECVFVWTVHHLALDRWGLSIIVRELFACYEAFRNGLTLQLDPPRRYGEYVAWLRKQDPAKGEAFWREELRGFKAPTALDWARKPENGAGGGHSSATAVDGVTLPPGATERIEALARANRLMLSTLIQGAWALLLSHYTQSNDVVFGTVLSGRSIPLSGVATIIGPFLNVLPMRVRIAAGDFILPWLRQVQERQMAIAQYEYYPLAQVQSWSEVPAGSHMFWSMVDLMNYTVQSFSSNLGGGLENTARRSVENVGIPLSLLGIPGAHLRLEISYNELLLDAHAITLTLDNLARLLVGIAGNPRARVSELFDATFGRQTRTASPANLTSFQSVGSWS